MVVTGVIAGLVGTLVMDVCNLFGSRTQLISRIDVAMIGRMAAGWARGRFCYPNPREMQPVRNEIAIGLASHYTIGVALAVPFVCGWFFLIGGSSWFFVYPSMGLGVLGLRSPEGMKATLSSLANHLFYGLGLALGVAVS